MKCIGLLGGMSWESTADYYKLLNQGVRQRLGGLHSAHILLHSVDFAKIEKLQIENEWDKAGELLASAAAGLQKAGAEALLVCTNLMHKVAPAITQQLDIPLLHIADATGRAVQVSQSNTVGLLGTRYIMEENFYSERLETLFGIKVINPEAEDRKRIHRVIFDELCCGKLTACARDDFLRIINKLASKGAEGIILGCTEIPLLIKQEQTNLPLFNTTELHVKAALDFMLDEMSS